MTAGSIIFKKRRSSTSIILPVLVPAAAVFAIAASSGSADASPGWNEDDYVITDVTGGVSIRAKDKSSPSGDVIIPDTTSDGRKIVALATYCYRDNISINSVTLGANVKIIGASAFYQATNLKRIVMNDSLTEIQRYAFYACYGLYNFSIPASVTFIGDNAFKFSSLGDIVIPASVTTIQSYAFRSVKSISFEDYDRTVVNGSFDPLAFGEATITNLVFRNVQSNSALTGKGIDWNIGGANGNKTASVTVHSVNGYADISALSSAKADIKDPAKILTAYGKVKIRVNGGSATDIDCGIPGRNFKAHSDGITWGDSSKTPVEFPAVNYFFVYDGHAKNALVVGDGAKYSLYSGTASGTAAGSYSFTLKVSDGCVWHDGTTYKTFKWDISKGSFDGSGISWTDSSSFTYDGTVKSVFITGLPAGITPIYTDNSASRAGTYVANATFNVDGNYNPVDSVSHTWSIGKATFDMSGVSWTGSSFIYDGTDKSVTLTGLPVGITNAVYSENKHSSAGSYTATASFTYDTANYNSPSALSHAWSIGKASYDTSSVKWSADSFVFDGTAKSVTMSGLPSGVSVSYYTDNQGKDVGVYYADAVLSYDSANFSLVLPAHRWEITAMTMPEAKEEKDKFFSIISIGPDQAPVYGGKVLEDPAYSEGNVVLKYYSDSGCTVPADSANAMPGSMWVTATVHGLANYAGEITSNPVEFIIPFDSPQIAVTGIMQYMILALMILAIGVSAAVRVRRTGV